MLLASLPCGRVPGPSIIQQGRDLAAQPTTRRAAKGLQTDFGLIPS